MFFLTDKCIDIVKVVIVSKGLIFGLYYNSYWCTSCENNQHWPILVYGTLDIHYCLLRSSYDVNNSRLIFHSFKTGDILWCSKRPFVINNNSDQAPLRHTRMDQRNKKQKINKTCDVKWPSSELEVTTKKRPNLLAYKTYITMLITTKNIMKSVSSYW